MQKPVPLVETALDAKATIGESPLWSATEQALYWIDIKKPALYRFEPASGAQRSWALTSDVGGFALLQNPPGPLVALRTGLYRVDFASGALTPLVESPFDPGHLRSRGACRAPVLIARLFDRSFGVLAAAATKRNASAERTFALKSESRSPPWGPPRGHTGPASWRADEAHK